MKITPLFTRLQAGENNSRILSISLDGEHTGKKAKLGFITPMGKIYISEELSLTDGKGDYPIPNMLLDGKGMLLVQLIVYENEDYVIKSPIEEYPVFASVDDMSCPVVSDSTLKSLALIFDEIMKKSDIGHIHDDRYYTENEVSDIVNETKIETRTLIETSIENHDHDSRYYTETEIDDKISEILLNGPDFSDKHNHDGRYYTETETDELLSEKSDTGHTHKYSSLSEKPKINGKTIENNLNINGLMYRGVLNADDDFDEIFEDGVYVYSTSSVPANAPFPNAAVVEVFGATSETTQKIQRAYRYGEKGHSAFRPLYSGSWGDWSYPLVTQNATANKITNDYVVEQGISGNWNYHKWASGVAECWGTVPIKLQKDAYEIIAGTGLYCASGFGGSVLKNLFTAYDCVSIDPINWYQISGSGHVTSGGTLEGSVYGIGSNMSSLKQNGTVDVNCIVKGRWK